MIDPKVFLKIPLQFSNICKIYPPTVEDVVTNDNGMAGYHLLTKTQEDINDLLVSKLGDNTTYPTPLEFVLINCYSNEEFKKCIIAAIKLFTHSDCVFVYESKLIIIGQLQDIEQSTDFTSLKILNNENFFDFQNILRVSMGEKLEEYVDYDNMNPILRKIKLAGKRRERIAQKNKKNKISFTTILCSICCMGLGITPLNIREMSYASVQQIIHMYQRKEKYETDLRCIMAGANPKKIKPKYWVREDSDLQEVNIEGGKL